MQNNSKLTSACASISPPKTNAVAVETLMTFLNTSLRDDEFLMSSPL